jgi:hypothetical protein
VPASTGTKTACGCGVTYAYACAADGATVSCGHAMSRGKPAARALGANLRRRLDEARVVAAEVGEDIPDSGLGQSLKLVVK